MNEWSSILDRLETRKVLRIVKRCLLYYVEADIGIGDWFIVDSFLTKRGAERFVTEFER